MNSVLQTSFFPGLDTGLFVEIGVILLTVSLTVFLALWTSQFFDSISIGIICGTGFFAILYLGATVLELNLLIVSPIAIGLSAVAVTDETLYAIVLTWTLSVFALAVLGLSWKLEYAEDQLAPSLIIGLLAASAGAQIYNLVWDVTAILIGTVALFAGIVVGAFAALSS